MSRLWPILLAALAATLVAQTAPLSAEPAAKQPLHVLYVGSNNFEGIGPSKLTPAALAEANAARAADFTRFLQEHFTRVTAIRAADFTLELAATADVIVADERIRIWMPDDFRVPIVAIGQMGMQTLSERGSKMDWLCACLDEKLHHVRTDHPIFRGPLPAEPTLVPEVDKTTRLPIRAWQVHAPMKTPGMVTSLANLLDARDSEIVAGGINLKGDHGISLAREANMFLWGPAAAPAAMTPEARRVFVNTLVYMRQFKGERPTVRREVRTRGSINGIIDSPYITRAAQFAGYFLPAVVAEAGTDKAKYHAIFDGNHDWVHVPPATLCFDIDQDAKSLNLPNHDVRLLDRCVELLGNPVEAAKARRLLERYTGLAFNDQAGWRKWLEANRAQLYFSDAFGYRFFAGPAGPLPDELMTRQALAKNPPEPTSAVAPVTVSAVVAGANGYAYGGVGDRFTLAVSIRVEKGWHIYDRVPAGNPMVTTEVALELPEGLRWDGGWHSTPPVPEVVNKEATGVMWQTGEVTYLRSFYIARVPDPGAGGGRRAPPLKLAGTVTFQACDEQRCLMPATLDFATSLNLRGN
jgi:hypothetical protein